MDILDILKNINVITLDKIEKKTQEVITHLKEIECTGEAGAGFVKVRLNGQFNIISIEFDSNNDLIKEDLIVFRDLIIAAHNDAVAKVREKIQEKFTDLFIPGMI